MAAFGEPIIEPDDRLVFNENLFVDYQQNHDDDPDSILITQIVNGVSTTHEFSVGFVTRLGHYAEQLQRRYS